MLLAISSVLNFVTISKIPWFSIFHLFLRNGFLVSVASLFAHSFPFSSNFSRANYYEWIYSFFIYGALNEIIIRLAIILMISFDFINSLITVKICQ